MTAARFYRLSLFVPLVLPAIVWALIDFADETRSRPFAHAPKWLTSAVGALALGALFYGIPYAAVALILWFRGREWTTSQWRWCAVALPALFSLFAGLIVAAVNLAYTHNAEWLDYALQTALVALGVGYGQVFLIVVGEALGRRLGWLETEGRAA